MNRCVVSVCVYHLFVWLVVFPLGLASLFHVLCSEPSHRGMVLVVGPQLSNKLPVQMVGSGLSINLSV